MANTIVPSDVGERRPLGLRGRLAARAVKTLLARSRRGTILLEDAAGQHRLGVGLPEVNLRVHDERVYASTLRAGSVGLATSYVEGWWDCDDVTGLVQILGRRASGLRQRTDTFSRTVEPWLAPFRRVSGANREKDRDNVRAHYDLSNEFFTLMLDETLSYSCAFFEEPSMSLVEASRAKLDRMCRKLQLGPDDHVVEIGTGWGGFALHAATNYGCRVTTTTISTAQFEYASKRVADAGLSERITVLNVDYRELDGVYDKLVSIEMIEAIGWRQLDTFFETCARLLRPEGIMGLQAIVIDDRSYERAKRRDDFIKRLIFPGGFLPSIEAMVRSTTARTDLRVVDLEDIGRHYAETLRRWQANLELHAERVSELQFGEPFARLWHLYLCYCEAAFLERHVSDVQMVLARDGWRGALAPRA